ncbi:MAG TPA: hypothetical protein VLD35_07890 [Caldimonas sp.]|nr:hypothetical protein [Caldimonas sp.]
MTGTAAMNVTSSPAATLVPGTARCPAACAALVVRGALVAGLVVSAAAASAQTTLTLYGGARGGGGFEDASGNGSTFKLKNGAAASASVDWLLDDGRQAQLFYSFQRSALPGKAFGQSADVDVTVHYLHLGGRAFLEGDARQGGGYVVGGLGATLFSPGLGGLSDELRPSANAGVGWQWPLARNVALRGELRGYWTLINSSGQFFCSGGCVVSIRGQSLVQAEALLGVSIGF